MGKKAKTRLPIKRKNYTNESLELALNAIKNGMSKKLASKTYGVPRPTLIFKLKNPDSQERPGPPTVLSQQEEKVLVDWIRINSQKGFPRRKEDLIASVTEYLKKIDRPNPFKNGIPGDKWYGLFLKRHPELALRTPESVTTASSCVSENDIRKWFSDIESYMKNNDYFEILNDPSRVLNGDETNFQLCPKTGTVLALKGTKNVYEVDQGQAKSTLTVMFTFKANGEQTPPMIIFPNKRLPKEITDKVPNDWGIGLSDNGWMKSELFQDYVKNVLHPNLLNTKTKFPVILFVDGHKTHVTLSVSELCTQLQIILIALYPNATRILQPADVSAFKPLKSAWTTSVLDWRRRNPSQALTKVEFVPILENAIQKSVKSHTLINGFKGTGLCPWNPDNIDFTKCLGKKIATQKETPQEIPQDIRMTRENFIKIIKNHEAVQSTTLTSNILKSIFDYFQLEHPQYLASDVNNALDFDIENLPIVINEPVEESQAEHYFEVAHEVEIHEVVDKQDAEDEIFDSINDVTKGFTDENIVDDYISDSCAVKENICANSNEKPRKTSPKVLVNLVTNPYVTPIKSCAQKCNLQDTLVYAKTPVRKGIKNTERTSFVLTSQEWQKVEKEKAKLKKEKLEGIQKRKEERTQKQLKKTNEMQLKKRKNTSSKDIPASKKIKVLSTSLLPSIIDTKVSPKFTNPMSSHYYKNKIVNKIAGYADNDHPNKKIEKTLSEVTISTPEKIKNVKQRIEFDDKQTNTNILNVQNQEDIQTKENSFKSQDKQAQNQDDKPLKKKSILRPAEIEYYLNDEGH